MTLLEDSIAIGKRPLSDSQSAVPTGTVSEKCIAFVLVLRSSGMVWKRCVVLFAAALSTIRL